MNKASKISLILQRSSAAGIVLLGLGLVACSHDDVAANQEMVISTATILQLRHSTVPAYYVTSGSVTSDHRVSISSRLSGYIRELNVREGDRVQVGQILVCVDPTDAKQALIQAEADLADAKVDKQRYDQLMLEGAVTSQQAAKANLRFDVAQSQVKQARNQLSYAEVHSPVDGVVVEKRLSQGDLASPGVPLLTLEDPTSLLVQTYVSENFVSRIHEDDPVDIHIPSLRTSFEGVIRQVVQAADPVSHQFLVKIALAASKDIHPGMFAEAKFRVGSRDTLFVPTASVLSRGGLTSVYVVDTQGLAQYRMVRLAAPTEGQIEVLAGLSAGDTIAWHGRPALKSGMQVQAAAQGQ